MRSLSPNSNTADEFTALALAQEELCQVSGGITPPPVPWMQSGATNPDPMPWMRLEPEPQPW
jgi:hypothetical protein